MSTKTTSKIFLSFCGFTIAISLHESLFVEDKKEMVTHITSLYRQFILKEQPSTIDFTLKVFDKQKTELLNRRGEKIHYINFFTVLDERTAAMHYVIKPIYLQIVFRHIVLLLLSDREGFLLHASGVKIHNKVVLFSAKSGTGKSTLVKLLSKDFTPMADDIVCIRKIGNKFWIFQTPFIEKNRIKNKRSKKYSLLALCFLHRTIPGSIFQVVSKNTIVKNLVSSLWSEKEYLRTNIKTVYDFLATFKNFYRFNLGTVEEEESVGKKFLNKLYSANT